jgi:hypothetical protein
MEKAIDNLKTNKASGKLKPGIKKEVSCIDM